MNESMEVSKLGIKNGRVSGLVKGLFNLSHEWKFKGWWRSLYLSL